MHTLQVPDSVPVSPEARDFLARLLQPDPAQRISVEQIVAHPWFIQGLPAEVTGAGERHRMNFDDQINMPLYMVLSRCVMSCR